jgi:phytoene dehydrogenase-like protein
VLGDQIVANAGLYLDGLESQIVGRRYESPSQIAARTGTTNGNVYHVDLGFGTTGPLRPARGFGGYRTPIDGLFITGAGSHPGPSVCGIPGQLAAREILRTSSHGEHVGQPAAAPVDDEPHLVGSGR